MSVSYLTRLRHSYGFGVHSPLAFRLVEDVLRPGRYAWYGYHDIELALLRESDRPPRRYRRAAARLLLRLASFCGVESVWIPSVTPSLRAALKAVYSRMAFLKGKMAPADMVALLQGGESPDTFARAVECARKVLLIFNPRPGDAASLCSCASHGVLLAGRRYIIYLPSDTAQLMCYDII